MSGRVSMALAAVDPDKRWRVGVVAKRTYAVVGDTVIAAPKQIPLAERPALAEDGLTLAHDLDVVLRKPFTDVVVLGHAYPHDGTRKGRAIVRLGQRKRTIRVFGERRLERSSDGLSLVFSPPERFEKISLGWASAYGGYDAAALEAYGDPTVDLRKQAGASTAPEFGLYAYPRNPAGKGYLVEVTPKALELCRLPQLEDPRHLLVPDAMVAGNSLAWPAGPPPASTAFLPHAFFPRLTLLGIPAPLYDFERFPASSFLEVEAGLIDGRSLAEDAHVATLFDRRGLQSSAPGLRWKAVAPGVEIELRGVHPREASWTFRLDARPPSMYLRVGAQRPAKLVPAIKTMVIEPDADRLSVLWVGEAPLDAPFLPAELEKMQHAVKWS